MTQVLQILGLHPLRFNTNIRIMPQNEHSSGKALFSVLRLLCSAVPKSGVNVGVWSSDQSRLSEPLPAHEPVWPHHQSARGLQDYPGLPGTLWHRRTPRCPLSIWYVEGQFCESPTQTGWWISNVFIPMPAEMVCLWLPPPAWFTISSCGFLHI